MAHHDGHADRDMPRPQVLGRRSLAQRKTDGRALGSLHSLVVAPQPMIDISRLFHAFLNSRSCMVTLILPRLLLLMVKVCEFIEYLWQNGQPKAFASDCLSGLGHFAPSVKKHLVGGSRLHGSWTSSSGHSSYSCNGARSCPSCF